MTFECFIVVGYTPDKNSGGNSTIPIMIKLLNKIYNNKVYFYIILHDANINTEEKRYLASLKYQEEFLPIPTPDMIMNKDNIVIYPENCGDNPLNFKNVARINYYFNININNTDNEYTIFYSSPFQMLFNKVRKELGINEIILKEQQIYPKHISFFYNLPTLLDVCYDYGNTREGSCYTIRKGAMYPHFFTNFNQHPTDAFLIPYELSNLHSLVEIFNKYKYFYSYDGFTAMSQMACLCGCISIIIPFSDYKNISEFTSAPWYLDGIAYGDSIEQINHAINTTNKCRGTLMKHAKTDYSEFFKHMIDSIYLYFYPNV